MTDAAEMLIALDEVVRKHAPEDVRAWWEQGASPYLTGRTTDLQRALGLNPGRGQESIMHRYYTRLRDEQLREAYRWVHGRHSSERREKLLAEIAKFRQRNAHQFANMDRPRTGWSNLWRAIFWALKYAHLAVRPVPESHTALWRILDSTKGATCEKDH